jgi:acetyltransferase-like isoleucine patch superfamily enzyme
MISITNAEKKSDNDADVYIEDDVWIGTNVTILKGVRIGSGSVIGAGSIVTKDIPPYTIHVGCPGITDKPRFSDEQIAIHKKLLEKSGGEENV